MGEIRIQVKAAAVNPTDTLLRAASSGDQTSLIVPGMDAAGVVEFVGAGVTRLSPGDRVMAAVAPKRLEGVDALLDTAVLGEASFGAIRHGGVYIPVRGWGDKPAERSITIKPAFVYEALERTD